MQGECGQSTFAEKRKMSIRTIPIASIDDSYSCFRLTSPSQVSAMQQSLASSGQLHPLIVCSAGDTYRLVDGFKRYHAARALKWENIDVRILEADEVTAKVMILVYNSNSGHRIAVISYRKNVKDKWDKSLFKPVEVQLNNNNVTMQLCEMGSLIQKHPYDSVWCYRTIK